MARALALARRGLFTTEPNPRVGCVIAHGPRVVGEGWHARAGGPHAEVVALEEAGAEARGACAYVTLEPCCHEGRTGPCTERLAAAGIEEVVLAMRDPNPRVSGGGVRALLDAGVAIREGLLEAEARALNPGFILRMERGRPLVRLKLAASLDGRTALASGESRWITGVAARADVHRLRARAGAILSGVGTVLADDPGLDVRLDGQDPDTVRQPLRVILDSALRTPPTARTLARPGHVLVLTTGADAARARALESAGAEVLVLAGAGPRVDLEGALVELAAREVNEVHVEAGATLAGALLAANLVGELVLYVAPVLLGDGARGLARLPGIARMADRLELEWTEATRVGEDLRLTARPRTTSPR